MLERPRGLNLCQMNEDEDNGDNEGHKDDTMSILHHHFLMLFTVAMAALEYRSAIFLGWLVGV